MTSDDRRGDDERVPAYAISWLVLVLMAVAVVLGLFLMLRPA